VSSAELAYEYPGPSVVRPAGGMTEVVLATSGGGTQSGPARYPYFFSGRLAEPAIAAAGMLACAAVARARYFLPGNVIAILRDPVVTSSQDRLRFESFSSCGGVHARLDLLPAAFEDPPVAAGSTNVDFNDEMRAALAAAVIRGPLRLKVGSDELAVDFAGGSVSERRVPLPDRWLKGFGEVQALARHMRPVGELSGAAAQRFLRSVPRNARRPLWVAPAPDGTFGLTAAARPGSACIAGPHRLAELDLLLRFARRLRAYGPPVQAGSTEAASAWELDFGSARFTLTLSPEKYRGFSGEGALLGLLADEEVAADAALVTHALSWDTAVDPASLAAATGLDQARIPDSLGYLAAAGRVGYDLADGSFFRRELPFGAALDAMHPRLASARELVGSGAVIAFADGAIVRSGGVEHRVLLGPAGGPGDQCTCPWWGKHRGSRGPCKHVLAARIAARMEA
jgi:SWIM zinc finger